MVKRISPNDKDKSSLIELQHSRSYQEHPQPVDYKDKVVLKPGGYEFLIYENEEVAIWYLHIKNGHATSMHCHPNKKTSLILLSGKALCNTFCCRNYLSGLDAIILEKGVFHSTKALSEQGIHLIEVESPPQKTDLVRLNDRYGRQNSGYEPMSEIRDKNLEQFNYFSFFPDGGYQQQSIPNLGFELAIQRYKDEIVPESILADASLYCLCEGKLQSEEADDLINVGDTDLGAIIKSQQVRNNGPLTLISASKAGW